MGHLEFGQVAVVAGLPFPRGKLTLGTQMLNVHRLVVEFSVWVPWGWGGLVCSVGNPEGIVNPRRQIKVPGLPDLGCGGKNFLLQIEGRPRRHTEKLRVGLAITPVVIPSSERDLKPAFHTTRGFQLHIRDSGQVQTHPSRLWKSLYKSSA